MRYFVKTDDTGRVQYIAQEAFASADMVPVGYLPDGDVTDYRLENGHLIFDPLPQSGSAPPQPALDTVWDDLAAAIREGVNTV